MTMLYEARHYNEFETPIVFKKAQHRQLSFIGQHDENIREFLADFTINDVLIERFVVYMDIDTHGNVSFKRMRRTAYANQGDPKSSDKDATKIWDATSQTQLIRAFNKAMVTELRDAKH